MNNNPTEQQPQYEYAIQVTNQYGQEQIVENVIEIDDENAKIVAMRRSEIGDELTAEIITKWLVKK